MLILWSILAAGAGLLAAVAAFTFWRAKRSRRWSIAAVAAIVAAVSALTAAGAATFVAAWLFASDRHSSTLPAAFEGEFGFKPAHDVQNIRRDSSGSTDSEVNFMEFRASRATVEEITSRRFLRASTQECASAFGSASRPPAWWRAPRASADCYVANPFDHAFTTNTAWLTYDAITGDVQYFYRGVD